MPQDIYTYGSPEQQKYDKELDEILKAAKRGAQADLTRKAMEAPAETPKVRVEEQSPQAVLGPDSVRNYFSKYLTNPQAQEEDRRGAVKLAAGALGAMSPFVKGGGVARRPASSTARSASWSGGSRRTSRS